MDNPLQQFSVPPLHLKKFAGGGPSTGNMCLMQMVDWFGGGSGRSDEPECASEGLTGIGTILNDTAKWQDLRDELWPLVFRLVGSRCDGETEAHRARVFAAEMLKGPFVMAVALLFGASYASKVHNATEPSKMVSALSRLPDTAFCLRLIGSKYSSCQLKGAANDLGRVFSLDVEPICGKNRPFISSLRGVAWVARFIIQIIVAAAPKGRKNQAYRDAWRSAKAAFEAAIMAGPHGGIDPCEALVRSTVLVEVVCQGKRRSRRSGARREAAL